MLKNSNKWGRSTSVFYNLWGQIRDRFQQSLFFFSPSNTDDVAFLSVCHYFTGPSRVRLCSWPQRTKGLPALSLGVSTISLSVTYIQPCLDLIDLCWPYFPGCPRYSGSWRVGWGTRKTWTSGPTRSWIARSSSECLNLRSGWMMSLCWLS